LDCRLQVGQCRPSFVKGDRASGLSGDLGDAFGHFWPRTRGERALMAASAWALSSASRISASARRAAGWTRLRQGFNTLARREPQRCSAVSGKTRAPPPRSRGRRAHSQHGRPASPGACSLQQARPGLCRLAVSVGDGHELLRPSERTPTTTRQHSRSSPRRTLKVDAVDPDVDVVTSASEREVKAACSFCQLLVRRATTGAGEPG